MDEVQHFVVGLLTSRNLSRDLALQELATLAPEELLSDYHVPALNLRNVIIVMLELVQLMRDSQDFSDYLAEVIQRFALEGD